MRLIAALLSLTVAAAAPAAPVPKPVPKTTAEKLVGTWKLTKSSQGNADGVALFVEFTKDGAMTIRQSNGDAEPTVYPGKYKVDGEKLPYSVKAGDEEKSETLTIKKLTDDELIVVDPDGIQEDFVRAKPGDKPKK